MNQPSITSDDRYAAVVVAFLGSADVTLGSPGKRGFGSSALQVGGKIFAMLVRGNLVVKLPRRRVDALVASGSGTRFDPGHGRLMKEWLAVEPTSDQDWLSLAREALEFVAARD
jgi:TfoX/Sxy family transcriptional regulator of competence genes